ncbi:MAG: zf-HC2 domain-containing protein [Chloracidobacterium sp.]|nr:zf-HC2 domain-containing protein [Chloracidobacterium sp.]
MKCSEIKTELALYSDGILTGCEQTDVKTHLDTCPVCRQEFADMNTIKATLRQMARPTLPISLQGHLKRSVRNEIRRDKRSWLPVSGEVRAMINMRIMPYAVGVMATLVMAFTLLTAMFSGIRDRGVTTASNPSGSDTIMLATNRGPLQKQYPDSLSASEYAKTRLDISSESPSVTPQGALIALTKSLVRGGMKDDEVVVVADVFGNGLARISEVIEPSRDSRAIAELQKALESDPAYSPFVTANLDKRSDSVRVVLRFQSVDVPTGIRPRKRR